MLNTHRSLSSVNFERSTVQRVAVVAELRVKREIDRDSPSAYYLQLSRYLHQQIEDGTYAVGHRIASESELCRQFGLSRATVREALRRLQASGLITLVPRRGAFVNGPKQVGWTLQTPEGFFEDESEHRHRSVETTVLRCEIAPLPTVACAALELRPGSPGLILERRRKLDGKLALYGVNYLIAELAPVVLRSEIAGGDSSLNRILREAGYPVSAARRSLEAVLADRKTARNLGVAVGHPLILIESVSWDSKARAFDYYTSWLRSDVVKVEIQVAAKREAVVS